MPRIPPLSRLIPSGSLNPVSSTPILSKFQYQQSYQAHTIPQSIFKYQTQTQTQTQTQIQLRSFSSLLLSRPQFPNLQSGLLSRLTISHSQLQSLPNPYSHTHIQSRPITYGTNYQPSQRKRKRKHGFLSRIRGGRLGIKMIVRRWMKGRRFLSH